MRLVMKSEEKLLDQQREKLEQDAKAIRKAQAEVDDARQKILAEKARFQDEVETTRVTQQKLLDERWEQERTELEQAARAAVKTKSEELEQEWGEERKKLQSQAAEAAVEEKEKAIKAFADWKESSKAKYIVQGEKQCDGLWKTKWARMEQEQRKRRTEDDDKLMAAAKKEVIQASIIDKLRKQIASQDEAMKGAFSGCVTVSY
jgi:hypothetical protein